MSNVNQKMPNVDNIPNAFNLLDVWSNNAILQNLPNFSNKFTDW